MCNNGFGGGNCCWIIILLIIVNRIAKKAADVSFV